MSSSENVSTFSTPPQSAANRERGAHFQGLSLREQPGHVDASPLSRQARATLPALSGGFGGSVSVDSANSPTSPSGPTRRHSEHRAASQGGNTGHTFNSFYTLGSVSQHHSSSSNVLPPAIPGPLGPIRGVPPLGQLSSLAHGNNVYSNAFGIANSPHSPYPRRSSTVFETSIHSQTHPLKRGSNLDPPDTPIGNGVPYIPSQLPELRRREFSNRDENLDGSTNGSNSSSNAKARSQTLMGGDGSINSGVQRAITPDHQKTNAMMLDGHPIRDAGYQSLDGLTSLTSGQDESLPNPFIHTGYSHPLGAISTRSGSTGTDTYYDASSSRRNTVMGLDPRRVSVVAVPPMEQLPINETSIRIMGTMPARPLQEVAVNESPYLFGERVQSPSPTASDSPTKKVETPSISPPAAAANKPVAKVPSDESSKESSQPLPVYAPIVHQPSEKLLSPNQPTTPKYGEVLTVQPYAGEPQRAPSLFESLGGQPMSVRQYAQRLSIMSDNYDAEGGPNTHRSRAVSVSESIRRRSSVGLHMRPQEPLSGAKVAEIYAANRSGHQFTQLAAWLGKQDTDTLIEEIVRLRVLAFGAQRGLEGLMTAQALTDLGAIPQPSHPLPYFAPRVSLVTSNVDANGNLRVPTQGPSSSRRASGQQNANAKGVTTPSTSYHPTNPHGLIQHQHSKHQQASTSHSMPKQSTSDDFFVDINDYMVVDEIGSGQYGTVVLAARSDTERRFAIKIIPKTRLRKRFQSRKASSSQSGETPPLQHRSSELPIFTAPATARRSTLADVPDLITSNTQHPNPVNALAATSINATTIHSPTLGEATLGDRAELSMSASLQSHQVSEIYTKVSVHNVGVPNLSEQPANTKVVDEDDTEEDWGSTPNLALQNNAISLFCGANGADYSRVNALNLRKKLPRPEEVDEQVSEAPSTESISLRIGNASGGILVSQIRVPFVADRTGSLQSPTGGRRNRSVQITAPPTELGPRPSALQALPGFGHRPSSDAAHSSLALRACSPGSTSALNASSNTTSPRLYETNEALRQEIIIMRQLRHRNIVPLEEVIDLPDDENVYLVMPYIEKGPIVTLHDNSCHPLEIDMVRTYVRQLLQAVSYLHKRHIVHCDIKPDNILIGDNGCVYLVDFGVSEMFATCPEDGPVLDGTPRRLEPSVSEDQPYSTDSSNPSITAPPVTTQSTAAAIKRISVTTSVVQQSARPHQHHRVSLQYEHGFSLRHSKCSPAFAAPESLTGDQFNGAKADMWSVGITMYVLVFGRTPYTSERAYDVFKQIAEEPIEYTAPLSAEMRSKAKSLVGIASASTSMALSAMRDDDDALEEAAVAMEQTCALQAAVYIAGLPTKVPHNASEDALEKKGLLSMSDLTSLGFDADHGLVKKYSAALNLLVNLLDRDTTVRFSARKALEHPFFGRSAFQQLRGLRQRANSTQSQTTDPPSVAEGQIGSLHHSTSSSSPRSVATAVASIA